MSGIYIPSMEMPNKKNGAVLIIYPDGKCAFEDGKTYQAVPVPPRGRLIDVSDAVVALLRDNDYAAALTVMNCPTIIPASEEGET